MDWLERLRNNSIHKYVETTFARINEMESARKGRIIAEEFAVHNSEAILGKDGTNYKITTSIKISQDSIKQKEIGFGLLREYRLLINDRTYQIPLKATRSATHILGKSEQENLTATLEHIHTGNIDDYRNCFIRFVIPSKYNIRGSEHFESKPFVTGGTVHMGGFIELTISEKVFHFFSFEEEKSKRTYFIIDSTEKCSLEEFKSISNSILLGYGLITGYLPREECYYLTSPSGSFEEIIEVAFYTHKKSIESGYEILTSQGPSFSNITPEEQRKLQLPLPVFSNLSTQLFRNKVLSRAAYLIVQGNVLSPEIRASVYSIAIETVTAIVAEENKEKLNPIKDKAAAKKIRAELQGIIAKYKNEMDDNGYAILRKKIDDINSPTNKDKLIKPFEMLGIDLTQNDRICIEKRNDFLHGRIPFESEGDSISDTKLSYVALRLHLLACSLILKYVGFSGYVVDYARMFVVNNETVNPRPYFREI